MTALRFQSDLSSTTRLQNRCGRDPRANPISERPFNLRRKRPLLRPAAALQAAVEKKPEICTADELHYVDVPDSDWRLALWRYLPPPQARRRNHPLLLLSGMGTSAIGFDLSPEGSFARYMAGHGYDTWTLELRGIGLSTLKNANGDFKKFGVRSKTKKTTNGFGEPPSFNFIQNPPRHPTDESGFSVVTQMKDFSKNLSDVITWVEDSSLPLFPVISSSLKDTKKQLDEMVKYSWDFENHLEEDLPAAMEYIKTQSKSKDSNLLAIGHSMGGTLLYARLAQCCFGGKDPGLASIATLGSSLDYSSSQSLLRMLYPLVDRARSLDVPAIPSKAINPIVHPLATHLSHALAWLNTRNSEEDTMVQHKHFEKIFEMLCVVPSNLIVQMSTAFQEGGMCNRNRTLFYKDHLYKSKVPILAIAGDQDYICPPEAVYETVKSIPEDLMTYKVFGEAKGPHYTHYDILNGHLAKDKVYPCIVEFLDRQDATY